MTDDYDPERNVIVRIERPLKRNGQIIGSRASTQKMKHKDMMKLIAKYLEATITERKRIR